MTTTDNPFGNYTPTTAATPAAPAEPAAPAAPAAPAQPAASYSDDPFGGPAPRAPKGPRFREMHGRLLLLIPTKLEKDVPNNLGKPGDTQDRMTADVIILDGEPVAYGGEPEKVGGKAHDKVAQIPHRNEAMYISYTGIISQCREALHNYLTKVKGNTMVLGRLGLGEDTGKGNRPWVIYPANDQDRALARAYLEKNKPADPFA